jgi:nitrous oxidase accessory protein
MKKIVLLTFALILLSMSMLGTGLVTTVSGLTTHHVYSGESIQEAVNLAQPGDTIFVHAGTYSEHVVINKTLLLVGENKDNTIIDGGGEGIVVYVGATGVGIHNFTIQRSGGGGHPPSCGIYVFQSNNVTILGNKITNNAGSGIYSVASNSCIIGQNVITDNAWTSIYQVSGVFLLDLNDTTICENYFENNSYGVYFYNSSHNNLKENYMTNNHHGIYLTESSNNTIANNSVLKSYRGIVLWGSCNNNRIINNVLVDSTWHNLLIYSSQNCMIIRNNFTNGGVGMEIADEIPNPPRFHNNHICHNAFVDNVVPVQVFESVNIWDNGYPSGGNYWSDYEDRYPSAKELDGSGIWDTPYVIDGNNQDNYPLMNPHTLPDMQLVYNPLYELLVNYNVLQSKYDSLVASYNSSQTELDGLQSKYNDLKNELNITRNIMYAFLITTIVFIATTVYTVIRKPKVKPELKIT